MSIVHYLNVNSGDCSIIEHESSRITVIDVCNARDPVALGTILSKALAGDTLLTKAASSGNFQQKKHPVNPIEYMRKFGYSSAHRFVLTGRDPGLPRPPERGHDPGLPPAAHERGASRCGRRSCAPRDHARRVAEGRLVGYLDP